MIRYTGIMLVAGATLGLIGSGLAHESGHVHGLGAHEHGVGRLDTAVDGARVQIEFESPAINLIGFEHAPRNDGQRAALHDALAVLQGDRSLLRLNSEARCTQQDARVLSALLDEEEEHDHDRHGHAHGDSREDPHADIFVVWLFECAVPDALNEIDARDLFQRFPGTERLRARAVTPRGQTSAELSASIPRLRW